MDRLMALLRLNPVLLDGSPEFAELVTRLNDDQAERVAYWLAIFFRDIAKSDWELPDDEFDPPTIH